MTVTITEEMLRRVRALQATVEAETEVNLAAEVQPDTREEVFRAAIQTDAVKEDAQNSR